MRMRLLVADDDPGIAQPLRRRFEEEGYSVDVAHDAASVLWAATENSYDVIILDVNIPRADDGLEICRRLRQVNVAAPVLFVTGRAEVIDRVAGLRAGASDYLAKPFGFAELAERVRALGRQGSPSGALVVGDLELDPRTRQVSRRGQPIALSPREFALLAAFMRRPDVVLSRTELLVNVWDEYYSGWSNVVDVYVRYLRNKIDRPFGVTSIETVPREGYRLRSA
jgi:two-component system OmpR family response regulator